MLRNAEQDAPPLSNAERQARWRARCRAQQETAFAVQRSHKPAADRRSRPRRWQDAVSELVALQPKYLAWFEALPGSLQDTATVEAFQVIFELNLEALASAAPRRGYGRD